MASLEGSICPLRLFERDTGRSPIEVEPRVPNMRKSRDRRNVSYFSIPHKRKVILRAQRIESILDLLINFRLLNSALQDDRSIRRNEMRHLLKSKN